MGRAKQLEVEEVIPSAARLVTSLRDVGYDFVQAVADLIDNSITAKASHVDVVLRFDGSESWVRISDDGEGMAAGDITEAMRYGSASDYEPDSLSRFGLGLKTASLSQCSRLTVASRSDPDRNRVEARQIDLDHVKRSDKWHIFILAPEDRTPALVEPLNSGTGTVVLWQKLDRVLGYKVPWGEKARNGFAVLADDLEQHLSMVFHRFLAGEVKRHRKLTISLNGHPIEPWDPFVTSESGVRKLPAREIELRAPEGMGIVRFQPYVLPPKDKFSSPAAFEAAGGPRRWNAQQGFYIYRANRLVQSGGWSYMRAADEHTKLARAAVEFFPDLDSIFEINVAKVRVVLPSDLREQLKQPVEHLCRQARTVYDSGGATPDHPVRGRTPKGGRAPSGGPDPDGSGHVSEASAGAKRIRQSLESAASTVSESAALVKIMAALKDTDEEVARVLGW